MKKKVTLLLSIFFLLLIIPSCKTLHRLPADEVLPYLNSENIEETAVDLLFQHYYWKLWANDSRYIIGELSRKERDEKRDLILKEIESLIPPD